MWYHARYQAQSAQGKSDPRLSATFALRWSRLIEHDITRGTAFFSPWISRMVLFFVQGSSTTLAKNIVTAEILERFSKPNFGSIRRFRTMTGLEIENWIEKRGRTVRKFRSTRPRTESNFRFGLTSCRSQNRPTTVWSPVAPLSGIRQFSLVTSSSSHHASHLRGFIQVGQGQNKLPFNWADDEFFYFGRRFSAGTWPSSVNEWARGVGHRITSDRGLGRRSPPDLHSLTKNTSLEHIGPRLSTARHQSSSAGHTIVWSIVFLFAERNFRLCVNRNFDTIFDPVLAEPNRIFGLLNLSIHEIKST